MRLRSPAAPVAILAFATALAVGAACSEKSLTNDQDGPSCQGLPVPTIACAVGPSAPVCSTDQQGRPFWAITCPGEGSAPVRQPGGPLDAGSDQGGTGGAAGGEDAGRDSGTGADGGGAAPACNTDSDCQLQADYCTGCDCRVLGAGQSLPACAGPGVACFADPCAGKTVRCVNGACASQ